MKPLRLLVLSLLLCFGCSDDDRPAPVDASADATADAAADATVDAAADAAADATADAASDAAADAAADATSDAAADATADAEADAEADANDGAVDASIDSSARGVNCDKRSVRCRIPEPMCPSGQVPQITEDGSCYTMGCVTIEMCRCTVAEECSDPLMYVCRRDTGRCTPPL